MVQLTSVVLQSLASETQVCLRQHSFSGEKRRRRKENNIAWNIGLNSFTAPACKISGLKAAQTHLKSSIVSSLITNLFQCYVF